VQTLARNHRRVAKTDASVSGISSGTDARLFTRHAAIPTVLYGPGDVSLAHTVNEYVTLDEVVQCARVLAHTIVEWSGAPHLPNSGSPALRSAETAVPTTR